MATLATLVDRIKSGLIAKLFIFGISFSTVLGLKCPISANVEHHHHHHRAYDTSCFILFHSFDLNLFPKALDFTIT